MNRSTRRPARVVFVSDDRQHRRQHRSRHPARGLPPPARARARRRSCSSRSSRAGSGATRSSAAATGSSRSRRPRAPTSRSSATSATTTSHGSSRRCRCPTTAAGFPESRFVVADVLVRFDHAARLAEVLAGDPDEVDAPPAGADPAAAAGAGGPARHDAQRFPTRRLRARRRALPGAHPRAATRSRSCSRSAPSGEPASRRSRSTARCAASTRRRTSSCSSSTALALVGSSPETLVRCEDGRASVNPIAGTTEPGDGDAERLLASEKDRAEHVMLVDLGRNDLSRVCVPGHGQGRAVPRGRSGSRTSRTSSRRSPASSRRALRRSTCCAPRFPAGTVSGAPKVRAMQIISELEGYRRGPYARRGALRAPGRAARRVHRDPHGRPPRRRRAPAGRRRDRRRLEPAGRARGVPAQARRARGGDRPRGGSGA